MSVDSFETNVTLLSIVFVFLRQHYCGDLRGCKPRYGRCNTEVCCYVYQLHYHRLRPSEMEHPGNKGSHAYKASVIFLDVTHIHTMYWCCTAATSCQSS